jgi:hypothetical protein
MSTIVIPAEAVDFRVAGVKLTNFPATGTFISVAKTSPNSAMTEGLHDTITHNRHKSNAHRITVTIMQSHPDDVFLSTAADVQNETNTVLAVSLAWATNFYVSVNCSILEPDTREIAADGSPTISYVFEGTFPGIKVIAFAAPETLTAEQINAALPPPA